jgi:ASC-1-like (ASCH) protein
MYHIAIMKKSWGLTLKILSGEKKIESRWYMAKCAPWDRIETGDIVYFKDSGCPVIIKTKVSKVIQFSNLTPTLARKIINKYGGADGIGIKDRNKFYNLFKNKKYCILVFLSGVRKIKPFNINKSGFGLMSAWMCVDDIKKVKIKDSLIKI